MTKPPSPLRRLLLPAIVCVTGACVLVVEVLATRLLAPYFGNTIQSLSSVLGVTLLALSCGYYAGGLLADRYPRYEIFFALIAGGGAGIGLIRLLADAVLGTLSAVDSPVAGPMLASLCLFFVPATLLGTLSPFAIRLQHAMDPGRGVGAVAGTVFFWSTVGSIAGSLLAGFVLIPSFGLRSILLGLALLLVALGSIGVGLSMRSGRQGRFLVLLALLVSPVALPVQVMHPESVVHAQDGVYQAIQVVRTNRDGRPIHLLYQDRNASSALYLDGDDLVFDYTPYYRLATDLGAAPSRALFIGAGAFSMPRDLLRRHPDTDIDVVDIEGSLLEIGKRYFDVPDTPRLRWTVADGRRYLSDSEGGYDLIFSDVYQDFLAIPMHFTTKEFFALAASKIAPRGAVVANVIGALEGQSSAYTFAQMRTFRESFGASRFYAVEGKDHRGYQNFIFIGCRGADAPACADPCAEAMRTHADPFFRNACDHVLDPDAFPLEAHLALTDDYAPVEYLARK